MTLPTELYCEIISIIFMDYLEDVMPDLTLLRGFTLEAPLTPSTNMEHTRSVAAEQLNETNFALAGPFDNNHLVPLLQTSYQVREATLSVLSNSLNIPRSKGRLLSKPWTCIRNTMCLYVNPKCTVDDVETASNGSAVLRLYAAIAHLEWQTWVRLQLDRARATSQPDHELEHSVVVNALGSELLTSISHRHVAYRAALSLAHNLFFPTVMRIRDTSERLLHTCDQFERLPFIDEVNILRDEVGAAMSVILEQIRDAWARRFKLSRMLMMLGLSLASVVEIIEGVGFETLLPVVVSISQTTCLTPEYEPTRKFAEDMLAESAQFFELPVTIEL